ncbi:MAG: hypothetical protein ABIE03_06060 [Patescibacteria group bacterium]|nr:hypothetical protein [Patescibacteria group bacterium]
MYPKEFFKLQLDFAQKASEITREDITQAILKYTNIYLTFGLDFNFSIEAKVWQNYIRDFKSDLEYTYQFYKQTQKDGKQKRAIDKYKEVEFGCFSYSIEPKKKRAWIHISNNEKSNFGPFSSERLDARRREMTEMLKYIKLHKKNVEFIKETSWFFAHENHNKVYPPEFIGQAAIVAGGELQFLSSWGQFIDSKGRLRNDLADKFRKCLSKKNTISDMIKCFPYPVKESEMPIEEFYGFYEVV